MRTRSKGFSLVELLIVIAIIAILMSIFLPVFAGIEALKKQTACQKNLTDIHKAFSGYCTMNDGWYPWPLDTYYGSYFKAEKVSDKDLWAGLTQVKQLKQTGAKTDIFFCPFDPKYGDWDAWPASTWQTPRVSQRYASTAYDCIVYIGYTMFTYRAWGGPFSGPYQHTMFTDGRYSIGTNRGDDDVPIVADVLHFRNSGFVLGWVHGGGYPDGFFNSSCNTLFNGGAVVYMDAGEFDMANPAFIIGSAVDYYWCAMGRGNYGSYGR